MGIQRGIRRDKRNYYCIAIVLIVILLMGVYIWSWYMCVKIEKDLHPYQASPRTYSDTECQFPDVDPFSEVAMRYNRNMPKIVCDGVDWVECKMSECKITQHINDTMKNIECHYKDILYVDEHSYLVAPSVKIVNDEVYKLNKSDFFKVSCFGYNKNSFGLLSKRWHGYNAGIRPLETTPVAQEREDGINILIVGFDSASYNGFVRKMPKSYKFLSDIGSVILKGYNIVGDGTPDALFPILSGRTELQHPYARQRYSKDIFLDPDLFIFHTAKLHGYQTAYYEDMPWIGSFQYRYNGFSGRPADHYLRSFLMEETKDGAKWWKGKKQRYCIGAKPQYSFLLNLTKQFMNLETKRFCFTFIADISHDEFDLISTADEDVVDFLNFIRNSGILHDTLLIVMGDHGPRFSPMRATYQGKIEERMAFMSILLPEKLVSTRPDAAYHLKLNAERLTTPFDIHTTILDAMGLKEFASDFYVPNSSLRRGLSLLKPGLRPAMDDKSTILFTSAYGSTKVVPAPSIAQQPYFTRGNLIYNAMKPFGTVSPSITFLLHFSSLSLSPFKPYLWYYKELSRNVQFPSSSKIPKSRTCEEAGILPHWCVCLNTRWYYVATDDPMRDKVTDALTEYINNVTEEKRSDCELRWLTSVEWVIRQDAKDKTTKSDKSPHFVYYQAMIVMRPGRAVFEGSLQYNRQMDTFIITDKDVSRISAYGNEPACISSTHPHLNKYCYCKSKVLKLMF